ncbi:hypothetical protein CH372_19350 [Leptospira meyeri]|uniref:hypothetical protein n=1 Tax=Leptospira meyeri TaxID=29508 RepID=UPI000C2AF9A2|nr:hypothetical protein [Leptospira meyeri]PKA10446.1 hypothetical protein CH372_19350 [Leptospira meyeri]PKA22661.1 hypothetical protein CH381_29775 [Leptospira sp. mixed culture ATI2-C-A1]TGM64455.1 hypothetical protein EHQ94_17870 [Leptospira meyeri]TGM67076.1 hypothetical protein EHQ93_03480 [Leptospira meyeri]
MKKINRETNLKLNALLLSLLVSFSCQFLPLLTSSDKDSIENNASSNFAFAYALLVVNQSKANYCPSPSQVLRKNTDYPITLAIGELYYFHYHYLDNAKPQEEIRTYLFKITKQNGTSVTYKENTDCNSPSSVFSTVTPTNVTATEQSYDLFYSNTFRQSWQIPNLYSVEVTSGNPTIILRQE